MDKVEYSKKLTDLSGSCGYCKVKKDITQKTERKLSQIRCKKIQYVPQMKYRQLQQAKTHVWAS